MIAVGLVVLAVVIAGCALGARRVRAEIGEEREWQRGANERMRGDL